MRTKVPQSEISNIGFLHPGTMGAALAALVGKRGYNTYWVSAGRSPATVERAKNARLTDMPSLEDFCSHCDLIISICPPHGAVNVARQVSAAGYNGLYLDANAISPHHALTIAEIVKGGNGTFVDGSVIGPPPATSTAADTTLFLSGEDAVSVATCFNETGLQVSIMGPDAGRASAIKLCHSAMHKGSLALLTATIAAAESYGVLSELEICFASRPSTSSYIQDKDANLRRLLKAWRFSGEMEEVSQAFASAGLPRDFPDAAVNIFSRLSALKAINVDELDAQVINALLPKQR